MASTTWRAWWRSVAIDTYYVRSDLVRRTLRHQPRLLVASVIPLSMLVAFSAMRWAGISGNLMSLGAIDFGLIVDGAVVMVENVLRVLYQRRSETGVPALEKVRQAARQVARPIVFGVGIIILVYLPILALRGIEGRMFQPMALTVVFALAASLVCSLTLMPALASVLLPGARAREPWLYRVLRRLYLPAPGKPWPAMAWP